MKFVMLSIKPQYCELIASGKKTVEVRKTRPKIQTPFKCYIYCTKGKELFTFYRDDKENKIKSLWRGKVIGEFVCRLITGLKADNGIQVYYNGIQVYYNGTQGTCLTDKEIIDYAKGKMIYYWHISDLVIYDKPKEVGLFRVDGECSTMWAFNRNLERPPRSWCYVEALE